MGQESDNRRELCNVQKHILIRIAALGYRTLAEWHRSYQASGGVQSYYWWRQLSMNSKLSDLEEAAQCLGVPVVRIAAQVNKATDPLLVVNSSQNESGGTTGHRVPINEQDCSTN